MKKISFYLIVFLMGFSFNLKTHTTKAFSCENDTCAVLEGQDGNDYPACVDHSTLPGSEEGWDCSVSGSTCTMIVCGL